MATTPSTNINIPYSPFLNDLTGRPNQEWLQWLMNPSVISFSIATALPVTSGGTGLTTIPTNGQLLIGNGTGYTLNRLTQGSGIGVTNGVGLITVANTGVLSNIASSGIAVSSATGNVTISNTGVLSFSAGSTGLTPATATTGDVALAGTLGAGYGGTGLNTYAIGDLLYASGATALSRLADVATGNSLISGGITTAPSWGKIGLTTHVSGILPIANGGTNNNATPTAGAIAYGTGTTIAFTAAGTTGQVLTSATAGTPTWTTPTTGTVTAVSVVSANGLAGSSSGGATPALTLSTTVTGVVKGNGTALSAATAATDYVAPSAYASANGLTMATARLLGRTTASTGAAEEISVAGGLTLSGGTLTGTSGTVTSVTGTAPVVSSGGATPAISMPAATTSVNGYLTSTDWTTFNSKQAALVSGTNIKTVNGTTLLGSGDLGTITYAYGGTGLTSYTAGDIIYASAANTVAKLAIGTSGQRLVVAAGLPSWATDTTTGTVTSVSFTGGIITVATATTTPALTVAGTSGGIPYFSSASTWASSAALAAGAIVLGGGAGVTPATTTTGTGVVTALGVNTGTAGAFVVNGGALGTPSSGTVTNLTGTASININGTVGATTANTGRFTTISASGTITQTGAAATTTEGLLLDGTTTGAHYATISNTSGNLRLGIDNSAGTALITGGTAYGGIVGTNNARSLHLITNGTSRIAIDSAGAIVAPGAFAATGTITTSAAIYVNGSGTLYNLVDITDTVDASGATFVQFRNSAGGNIGRIARVTTTNAVTYNTTSDYRLKNKQAPLIGSGAFIDALQPKTWEWAESGVKAAGFIAHEFAEVSPSSVSGEKDGTEEEEYEVSPAIDATLDEDGNELTPAVAAVKATRTVPLYQGMQASSSEVIANLVAEIQLLRRRVAALEAV